MFHGHAAMLIRELELVGVGTRLRCNKNGVFAHGEALRMDAQGPSGTEGNRLLDALADGRAASVTVTIPGREPGRSLQRFCRRLRKLLRGQRVDTTSVGLAVSASRVAPQAAWLLRQQLLGDGMLHLFVDGALSPARWRQLWHMRDWSRASTAIAATMRSPCPLLIAESCDAVVPGPALAAPPGSAWVPLRLDLARFADEGGHVNENALDRALAGCIAAGDGLHELCDRCLASTRHDAWFNRRLSVDVEGIGDLAVRRRIDPSDVRELAELRAMLRYIGGTLRKLSGELARSRGFVPALQQSNPALKIPAGDRRSDWHMRWQRATEAVAVRHRNLLTMSPWGVFSRGNRADYRHAELLPLITAADCISYRRGVSLVHWNVNEFKEFHQRIWALVQHRNEGRVLSEPV